MFAPVKS